MDINTIKKIHCHVYKLWVKKQDIFVTGIYENKQHTYTSDNHNTNSIFKTTTRTAATDTWFSVTVTWY